MDYFLSIVRLTAHNKANSTVVSFHHLADKLCSRPVFFKSKNMFDYLIFYNKNSEAVVGLPFNFD